MNDVEQQTLRSTFFDRTAKVLNSLSRFGGKGAQAVARARLRTRVGRWSQRDGARIAALLTAVTFLAVEARPATGTADALFQEGLSAADAGDYGKAQTRVEQTLTERPGHGAFFNLARLAEAEGRPGAAAVYDHRAWLIDPRHAGTRERIEWLRPIGLAPESLKQAWSWLTLDEWTVTAVTAFWILASLGLLRYYRLVRGWPWHTGASLAAAVVLVSAWGFSQQQATRTWRIALTDAPLRPSPAAPDFQAQPPLRVAPGEVVQWQESFRDFHLVTSRGGAEGWLENGELTPLWPEEAAQANLVLE